MSVAPKKALGQHFLVDENILGVIGRLAELDDDDVVLEVGPGLGRPHPLPRRARRDRARRRARPLAREPLAAALAGTDERPARFRRRPRARPRRARAARRKLVANLPYNIATPLVVESLDASPSLELWCVMVQREVADRFFAAPRTKAYGAVSVLVQLQPRRIGFHPVAPTVFRPRPRVDSALVAFERVDAPSLAAVRPRRRRRVRASAEDACELARALRARHATARGGGARRDRQAGGARAEELAPHEFVALAEALVTRARAFAKINLALVVGPAAPTASTRSPRCCSRSTSGDDVELAPASGSPSRVSGRHARASALERLAAAAGVAPAWHVRIEKRIPVAAGLGGGSSDAAAALGSRTRCSRRRSRATELHAIAAAVGADVPFFLGEGPQLGTGDGTELADARAPARTTSCSCSAARREQGVDGDVYRQFDERGGAAGFEERRSRAPRARSRASSDARTSRRSRGTTSPPRRSRGARGARGVPRRRQRRRPVVYGLFERREDARACRCELSATRDAPGSSVRSRRRMAR